MCGPDAFIKGNNMYDTTSIEADLDPFVQDVPERGFFCAIVMTAIQDARSGNAEHSMLAREAMDFLFSDRVNPYLELLEYDPDTFKSGLIKTNHSECTSPTWWENNGNNEGRMRVIARENKLRRIFRHNYAYYKKEGKFKTALPWNLIYNSFGR